MDLLQFTKRIPKAETFYLLQNLNFRLKNDEIYVKNRGKVEDM